MARFDPIAPYLLVLGASHDRQLQETVERLVERGANTLFLDYSVPTDIEIDVGEAGSVELRLNGRRIGAPSAVWKRLKMRTVPSVWDEATVLGYVQKLEWSAFLNSLALLFRDRAVYSHQSAWESENKPVQLALAGRCGFQVPNSLFFTGKTAATRFLGVHKDAVAKPLAARNVPKLHGSPDNYRVLFTMAVDEHAISQAADDEFTTPSFFQKRLRQGREYRVIAFRDRIFAYRIRQAVETRDRPDERILLGGELDGRSIYAAQYEYVEDPPGLAPKIREFLVASGLEYAAMDVIIDYDGVCWFLESNAEGQWFAAADRNYIDIIDHWAGVLQSKLDGASHDAVAQTRGEQRCA